MKKESFANRRPKTVKDKSRKVSFGDDLFKHLDGSMWPKKGSSVSSIKLSEKSLILDSTKQFIEEKAAEKAPETINIMGAKAVLKNDHTLISEQNYQVINSASDLRAFCDQYYGGQSISDYRYQDKLVGEIDYLFVSDLFYEKPSLEGESLPYLGTLSSYYFQKEAAGLFSNIAKALSVDEEKIGVSSLKSELIDDIETLFFQEVAFYKPKIVISLGARVTNGLLKERKRIADVHGQIFNRSILVNNQQQKISIMPLFHPEFLSANPKMKAAAWNDLQLAMKFTQSN